MADSDMKLRLSMIFNPHSGIEHATMSARASHD
jgi:hypothetical protein